MNMDSLLAGIEAHVQGLSAAAAGLGTDMWPSVLDVRTGRYPDGDHTPRRVYRLIGAPRGSTLYWDQPLIVVATLVDDLAGRPRCVGAVDRYIDAFLAACLREDGLFRWGNHAYYDVVDRRVVEFHGGPHELRPITPAWELFRRRAPAATDAYVRLMARRHVYDPETGGFNRHDDAAKGHAFLEAGGILVESLAWLHGRTGDASLLEAALRIARYSFRHRDPRTGLVPNEPDMGRWDSKVCTSEIGLWAQCLLRAAGYTSNGEFVEMAAQAARAYLRHAYDAGAGRYFGQVSIATGAAVVPDRPGYWPREHADPWSTDQWPTHDYPMALAEACLTLRAITGDDVFDAGARRLAAGVIAGSPGRTGRWAYAESYGRCIHVLARAGQELGEAAFTAGARELAEEAIARLWADGLCQGYPGSHLYESVDGVGYLFLALLRLEASRELDLYGFGF